MVPSARPVLVSVAFSTLWTVLELVARDPTVEALVAAVAGSATGMWALT